MNCHSRQFLLGSALLNMAEPEKACDWMIQAAGGVVSDRFLSNQVFSKQELEKNDENNESLDDANYFAQGRKLNTGMPWHVRMWT